MRKMADVQPFWKKLINKHCVLVKATAKLLQSYYYIIMFEYVNIACIMMKI